MAEESIVRKIVVGAGQGLLAALALLVGAALMFGVPVAWMLYAATHFEFWWGLVLGIGGMTLWVGVATGITEQFFRFPMPFSPVPPPPPIPPYYRITTGEKD